VCKEGNVSHLSDWFDHYPAKELEESWSLMRNKYDKLLFLTCSSVGHSPLDMLVILEDKFLIFQRAPLN
jgi:hypothetical protein